MGAFRTSLIERALARAGGWLAPHALVLMYHRVTAAARDPWQLAVSPAHFAEHLEVVRRYGRSLLLAANRPEEIRQGQSKSEADAGTA